MKDDWIKDIQNKMIDFEVDEPQGLWDDIYHSIPQIEKNRHSAQNNHITWMYVRRMAATAAIIALVFTFTTYHHTHKHYMKPIDVLAKTDITDIKEVNMPTTDLPSFRIRKLKKAVIAEVIENMENVNEVSMDSTSECSQNEAVTEQKTFPRKSSAKYNHKYLLAQDNSYSKSSDRLSCSVLLSGGTFSSSDSRGNESILVKEGPYDTGEEESLTEIKHHIPIRFGLLIDYKFNNKLSLESGVVYTRLSSDIKEGTESCFFTGKQQLDYVGIPINLKYQIAKWNHLELYASSGITIEKCVSAKRNISHYSDNILGRKESINLESKPFQFSVNTAAGIEYHVAPMSSIYVEPNLGLYFNDGSSLNHLYKDNPLVISLNVGLRFNILNK